MSPSLPGLVDPSLRHCWPADVSGRKGTRLACTSGVQSHVTGRNTCCCALRSTGIMLGISDCAPYQTVNCSA